MVTLTTRKKLPQIHSKNCWVVLTQLWVRYGQTQPLGYIFLITFLTQRLGLPIFDPKLG